MGGHCIKIAKGIRKIPKLKWQETARSRIMYFEGLAEARV